LRIGSSFFFSVGKGVTAENNTFKSLQRVKSLEQKAPFRFRAALGQGVAITAGAFV
jgi:hypothetical protein